jgi:hypothetical protein
MYRLPPRFPGGGASAGSARSWCEERYLFVEPPGIPQVRIDGKLVGSQSAITSMGCNGAQRQRNDGRSRRDCDCRSTGPSDRRPLSDHFQSEKAMRMGPIANHIRISHGNRPLITRTRQRAPSTYAPRRLFAMRPRACTFRLQNSCRLFAAHLHPLPLGFPLEGYVVPLRLARSVWSTGSGLRLFALLPSSLRYSRSLDRHSSCVERGG